MNREKIEKLLVSIVAVIVLGIIVVSVTATYAWWTWHTSNDERTIVNFNVPDGNNQLSAILDADSTNFTGLSSASGCSSDYASMATITLYYENLTQSNAFLETDLSLDSITNSHTGIVDRSQIHWALSTEPKATCSTGYLTGGTGTLANKDDGDVIYTGDLGVGTISSNTSMQSTTLYLYVWIDSNYEHFNYGNSIVTDPMQDMTVKVTWSGTITNTPQP